MSSIKFVLFLVVTVFRVSAHDELSGKWCSTFVAFHFLLLANTSDPGHASYSKLYTDQVPGKN